MWKYIFVSLILMYQNFLAADYVRGCYYSNGAQYRSGFPYYPENYIPDLCTHIYYASASMTDTYQILPTEPNDLNTSTTEGMYSRVLDLKKQQPNLKVLLTWGSGDADLMYNFGMNATCRQTFIISALSLLNEYGFDGLDVDWEFPSNKTQFTEFLRELRMAFDKNVPPLMITAAVAGTPPLVAICYETSVIGQYLDYLDIMCYDFHGDWEMQTGQNSPLYDRNNDNLSIANAVELWTTGGFPRNKIVVGLPTYGRGWTLLSASNYSVGAPAVGPSFPRPYSRSPGELAYFETCPILEKGGQRIFDDCQKVPDLVHDTQWYTYDDPESFEIKLNWVKNNSLAGAFAFTLDNDDFNATCKSSRGITYPIIKTMKRVLEGST